MYELARIKCDLNWKLSNVWVVWGRGKTRCARWALWENRTPVLHLCISYLLALQTVTDATSIVDLFIYIMCSFTFFEECSPKRKRENVQRVLYAIQSTTIMNIEWLLC